MRPVQTEECNLAYKMGPDGAGRTDLPVRRQVERWVVPHPTRGVVEVKEGGLHPVMKPTGEIIHVEAQAVTSVTSWWLLDTDDMVKIQQSHMVRLLIWGEPIPPVSVAVVGTDDEVAQEAAVSRPHLERAIGLLCTKLEDMGYDAAPPDEVLSGLDQCLLETAE